MQGTEKTAYESASPWIKAGFVWTSFEKKKIFSLSENLCTELYCNSGSFQVD